MTNPENPSSSAMVQFFTPDKPFEFTGERYVSKLSGLIQYEHHHRYLFARQFCTDKDVLDIACGEGYGSALLSQVARHVVGMDIDQRSIEFAKSSYRLGNLDFVLSSAAKISAEANSFDVIISFETIEHFAEHEAFMDEVRRILRPKGLLIISSPNRAVYTELDEHWNKFHVREMDRTEFRQLLSGYFKHTTLLEQRAVLGSVLAAESDAVGTIDGWEERDIAGQYISNVGIPTPHYFIAIASDGILPKPNNSVLHGEKYLRWMFDQLREPGLTASNQKQRAERPAQEIAELESKVKRLQAQIQDAKNEMCILKSKYQYRIAVNEAIRKMNSALMSSIEKPRKSIGYTRADLKWWASRLILSRRRMERRMRKKIRSSGYFDPSWYLATYPDVAKSKIDAEMHFVKWGAQEGRDPSIAFSVEEYSKKVPRLPRWSNPLFDAILNNRLDLGKPSSITAFRRGESIRLEDIRRARPSNPSTTIVFDARGKNAIFENNLGVLMIDDYLNQFEIIAILSKGHSEPRVDDVKIIMSDEESQIILNRILRTTNSRYVLYIDRNIEISLGSLSRLLKALELKRQSYLICGKLLGPDWRTISAGLMFGSGDLLLERGKGAESEDFEFGSLAEVDGIGAAFFGLNVANWTKRSGFNENKSLRSSIEEASILARNEGLHNYCEPRAVAYQDVGSTPREERRSNADSVDKCSQNVRPKVLFIDAITPKPDHDSGSVDIFNYMQIFNELGYEVTFLPAFSLWPVAGYTDALRDLGIVCVSAPAALDAEVYLKKNGSRFDVILIYRCVVADMLIDLIREKAPKTKIIFDTVDLHFLRAEREAQLTGDDEAHKSAKKLRELELSLIQKSDCSILLSQAEYDLIEGLLPGATIRLIPVVREIPAVSEDITRRNDILFIGGFDHKPNVDGILWFTKTIWPLVREKCPDIKLLVVGSNPTPEILELDNEDLGINVLGFVQDLNPILDKCRVTIAPLRYGAGVKGKIVMSLMHGIPCVATPVATEGMGLVTGKHILVAKNPVEFADSIVSLERNDALWETLSKNGRHFAKSRFSIEAVKKSISDLLEDLGLPIAAPGQDLSNRMS
ncbi:glycosyltransferase [Hyphomicrobium sp. 802]|uniref:glycosyltransferase n=1 Tax=Hyphomicrobium sp. 802 TaxID=1112272 RepID=UPI0004B7DC6E|nr:glycosyltransferase [Hyphomicrobium sp. 802]